MTQAYSEEKHPSMFQAPKEMREGEGEGAPLVLVSPLHVSLGAWNWLKTSERSYQELKLRPSENYTL